MTPNDWVGVVFLILITVLAIAIDLKKNGKK